MYGGRTNIPFNVGASECVEFYMEIFNKEPEGCIFGRKIQPLADFSRR